MEEKLPPDYFRYLKRHMRRSHLHRSRYGITSPYSPAEKEINLDDISIIGLDIRNFRGFDLDSNDIPLSKVNLVFGPNSGGKSTLLKALASFPQTLSENRNNVQLERPGNWVSQGPWFDLGGPEAILHRVVDPISQNSTMSIGFKVRTKHTGFEKLNYRIEENRDSFDVIFLENEYSPEAPILLFRGDMPTTENTIEVDTSVLFSSGDSTSKNRSNNAKQRRLILSIRRILRESNNLIASKIMVSIEENRLRFWDIGELSTLHEISGILRNMRRQDDRLALIFSSKTSPDMRQAFMQIDAAVQKIESIRTRLGPSHRISDKEINEYKEDLHTTIKTLFKELSTAAPELVEPPFTNAANPRINYLEEIKKVIDVSSENKPTIQEIETILESSFGLCRTVESNHIWKLQYEFDWAFPDSNGSIPLTALSLESENKGQFEKCIGIDLEDYIWYFDSPTEEKIMQNTNETYSPLPPKDIVQKLAHFIDNDEQVGDLLSWIKRDFFDYCRYRDQDHFDDEIIQFVKEADSAMLSLHYMNARTLFRCINLIVTGSPEKVPKSTEHLDRLGEIFDLETKKEKKDFIKMLEQHSDGNLSEECNDIMRSPKIFDINAYGWESYEVSWPGPQRVNGILVRDAIGIMSEISKEVSKFLTEIDYLGANRLSPLRYFETVSSSSRRVGVAGVRSIISLKALLDRKPKEIKKFNQMMEKVVGKNIKFKNVTGTNRRMFEVKVSNPDETSVGLNLADVGHGISQCIPLIGSTLTDSVLLCEEAESNLHPAAQARLMTTLLESYAEKDSEGNPLMILETHSEHFLKALLRHLETGEGLSDEDVCVLYVEEQDGRTVVKRIRTKDGEFVDPWPRNRWDDETNPII